VPILLSKKSVCYSELHMSDIQKLRNELLLMSKYGSALGVLGWDQEVNLPKKGHAFRGEVNALLSADLHRRFTSKEFVGLVKKLHEPSSFDKLSDDEKIIVRETWRDLEKSLKIPTELVEQMARLSTEAFAAWAEAREKSDFKIYKPFLEKIVALNQKEAELLGYKSSPYDALLDGFEPDLTAARVEEVFTPLAKELAALVSKVKDKPKVKLPKAKYPIDTQVKMNRELAADLGYDLDAGRIDVSPHPFTTGFHPTDVRITTRYNEDDFYYAVGCTVHETGHALYEQGLLPKYYGTPMGEVGSLGLHESQSRMWENFVGRSHEYCHYLNSLLVKYYPDNLKLTDEQVYEHLNYVQPSLIRVEADEVTYNLHIVLRFEIEKGLIEGTIKVAALPEVWNAKMKQYLGVDVPDDAHGVLQDVHWSHGTIGYFPTYTLGNIYAAQLFHKAKKEIPNLEKGFARGEFAPLLKWLRKNIHQEGSRYYPEELIKKVTGEGLNSKYLIDYLKNKNSN
jgi:carboxypeptidase Taq